MTISSIRRRSHLLLVLGVALFLFNGIFQPLFSFSLHDPAYVCQQEFFFCRAEVFYDSPYSDVTFAWRNDDLSDFYRKNFALVPPEDVTFEIKVSESSNICLEVQRHAGLKIDKLFSARAPPMI